MLAPAHIEKAHGSRLLEDATASLKQHWKLWVRNASELPIGQHLARGDVEGVLRLIDGQIARCGNAWTSAFVAVGNRSAQEINRKLRVRKARPTVAVEFDAVDPVAVELMRRNKLRLVRDITQQQRNLIRPVLVRGVQEGLGVAAIARQLRTVVGLSDQGAKAVQAFETALRQAKAQELELPEGERGPVISDTQIKDRVERLANKWRALRADSIARTESTRIVGLAQDQAVRQSIKAVGQSARLTGKIWRSTHDGRTRDAHADRDGERRGLDEEFAPGVMKPGDGDAREAVRCRCVLEYVFFDTTPEYQTWREAA